MSALQGLFPWKKRAVAQVTGCRSCAAHCSIAEAMLQSAEKLHPSRPSFHRTDASNGDSPWEFEDLKIEEINIKPIYHYRVPIQARSPG
ncbi:hypothetical protein GUJ93_ZPchr0006g44180 [Zizania palustris]|uniref:Uncharacterized protein n=1 Tax=Zizania palustris TaxID=103762 RepID=A0A8J5SM58_ZIZPA|nr:hypothetical protein GUJ93_ZPchr0006g44180 [Zizania palustris]